MKTRRSSNINTISTLSNVAYGVRIKDINITRVVRSRLSVTYDYPNTPATRPDICENTSPHNDDACVINSDTSEHDFSATYHEYD